MEQQLLDSCLQLTAVFPPSLLWFWTLIGSSSQMMVLQLGAQSDRCTRLQFSGLLVTRTALWKFIIDEATVDNCECLKIVSKPSCGMLKASGCFRCTQLTHTVSVWWVKMQRFGRQAELGDCESQNSPVTEECFYRIEKMLLFLL